MRYFLVVILAVFFSFSGCDNPKQPTELAQKPNLADKVGQIDAATVLSKENEAVTKSDFMPFYVYSDVGSRDNHYVPSGFMPNGECLTFTDKHLQGCNSGKTCIKIDYDVECSRFNQKWAGIYWLNPPNNWGNKKGGFDLTGASKLTFWAKGEKGGEQIQEVTIGGITGNYPDSDTAVIGPIILTDQWKKYTIDLRGKDLSYISGGFAWTTSEDVNPVRCVFYIDEIRFE